MKKSLESLTDVEMNKEIWYSSRNGPLQYDILNPSGEKVGFIFRQDLRFNWSYRCTQNNTERFLGHRDLAQALYRLNMNVRWMEQLTHFEEVK